MRCAAPSAGAAVSIAQSPPRSWARLAAASWTAASVMSICGSPRGLREAGPPAGAGPVWLRGAHFVAVVEEHREGGAAVPVHGELGEVGVESVDGAFVSG